MTTSDRLFDDTTERLIIGSILNGSASMDSMRSTMDSSDFANNRHKKAWEYACKIYDDGRGAVDALCVANAMGLQERQLYEEYSYLVSLLEGLPELPSLDRHIERLKSLSLLRKIAEISSNIQQRAMSGIETGEELRGSWGKSLADLSESAPIDQRPVSSTDLIDRLGVEGLLRPRGAEGVRLPWDNLSRALRGLRGGQNVILAADTGRGKTSAALQIATHVLRQGKSVMYWSLEMPAASLFSRMVTQMTGADKNSNPTFEQREIEREAVGFLYEHPIYFDCTSRTVPAFCAKIRQIRNQTRLGLIIVDYLQLIRGAGRVESRTREVGENSRSLKLATLDFNLPFLVLSQFARLKEGQTSTIHSLKESGDCENDADVILLLDSPELSGDNPSAVSMRIGKQREGPAGISIPLIFYPKTQSFMSSEDM